MFVFFIYSWALYRAAWYLPSWLFYLNVKNILILVAYILAFCLFESVVMAAFLSFLSILLPSKYFKERFTTQGSSLAAVMSISAILAQRKIGLVYDLDPRLLMASPFVILMFIFAAILGSYAIFRKFKTLTRWVNALAERMTVFTYIYVPLGFIGVIVVLLRNLF